MPRLPLLSALLLLPILSPLPSRRSATMPRSCRSPAQTVAIISRILCVRPSQTSVRR